MLIMEMIVMIIKVEGYEDGTNNMIKIVIDCYNHIPFHLL